jgi:hypothetical protein
MRLTDLSRLSISRGRRRGGRALSRAWRPTLDALESRLALSTASASTVNFNPTPIPAGDTLWFSASLSAAGLGNAPVTLHVENSQVSFTSGGTNYSVPVPNGVIVFTPGATSTSVSYDPTDNDYDVSTPSGGAGNVFMGGVALPLPAGLPGGIKNVTWSATFWSDTANVDVHWKWGAAVYSSFGADNNALGIKAVDAGNSLTPYQNPDHAGTPEAFKSSLVAGGTGNGGNNFTGNLSPDTDVKPSLGSGTASGTATYPFPSSNPLTSVAFNESGVLEASKLDAANGTFDVWYSDEHALALGVRQVNVKTAAGTTTTNYAVTAMTSNPGAAANPSVGTTATTGDQAGTDTSGRLIAPSLYITDITTNPNSLSGDWQYGGTAVAPSAVFGAWKSFVRTVDYTQATPTVSVTADVDPVKNGWNLGPGSDAPPSGTANQGYGAEVKWDLNALYAQHVLIPGHNYRFYVIIHDGDQNKTGGDAGQAAYNNVYPGPPVLPATISGAVTGPSGVPLSGVVVTLVGTDNNGNAVNLQTTTDSSGDYTFTGLAAGNYTLERPNPVGYVLNQSTVGHDNGLTDGTVLSTGDIAQITIAAGDNAVGYLFGEQNSVIIG